MKKKVVTAIFLILLLLGTLTLTYNIQSVKANETIYSRTDENVDPSTASAGAEITVTGTEENQIAYDDGTIDAYTWWTGVGGIFAVRFTPPVSGQLKRCPVYIYSNPAAVKIHVMNSEKIDIITPFTYDVTTTGWININLLAYEINISTDVDFYIGLEWTMADSPTLGVDMSSPDSRSWDWNGEEWSLQSDRDYMIRAIIEHLGDDPDIDVDPMHLDFYAQPSTSTPAAAQENSYSADYNQTDYPLMQPDNETLKEWMRLYNNAPQAYINPEFVPPTGSFNLLDHLEYTPSERDQGVCGNCWVWASTGTLEVALDVQENIKDRLSTQYFTSSWHGGTANDWACCGGTLEWFADWYQNNEFAIPWSNTNAYWQDENRKCEDGTSVPAYTISTTPNYPISSCTTETIETHDVGQATTITNIKNVLHQDKAVYFAFYLPNSDDWDVFFNSWNNEPESTAWSPDYSDGHTYLPDEGGGHAVLCVGYNDMDPNNSYWIMVNSWGTAGGGRPNGIFHLDMDINYDCWLDSFGYSLQWQTLDVVFEVGNEPITISNVGDADLEVTSIQCDQPWLSVSQPSPPSFVVPPEENHTAWICADPTSLDIGIYYGNVQIYSNDPDETPVTVTVTLYIEESTHLVVQGFTNRIYYRSYEGSWDGWNVLPGSTCDGPAAAFLGNNLHIVVRSIDGSLLWHGYLTDPSDPNSFSGWILISGATPSTPTLASNGTALYLVVRGLDNRIYYRRYDGSWGKWNVLPGSTCDGPAAAFLGDDLHIVVRSIDGVLLWHGYLTDPSDPASFSGWNLISGSAPSTPTLTSNGTALYLVVRGLTNSIYYRIYDGSWDGWNVLPGTTCDGTAAAFLGNNLHIVVRSIDGSLLWHGYLTDPSDPNSFSGWILISGATPSTPTLTS